MSKRSRPFPKNPESTNRKLYKEGGHGTYTKKRHPNSKWVLNGAIK
jgi:hypothetical protein